MCSSSIKLICGCCFALAFLTSLFFVPSQIEVVKEVEGEDSDVEDTAGASSMSGLDQRSLGRPPTHKRIQRKTNYAGYLQIVMVVLMIVSGCIYVYHSEVGSASSLGQGVGDASGSGTGGVVQNVHLSKQNVLYHPNHSNNQTETLAMQESYNDSSAFYAPPSPPYRRYESRPFI